MTRSRRRLPQFLLPLLCLAVCPASAEDVVAPTPTTPTVVLLQPRVVVYEAGFRGSHSSPAGTSIATDNVHGAWRAAVQASGHFVVIDEPYVSPEEAAAINQLESMVEVMAVFRSGTYSPSLTGRFKATVRRQLGEQLAFLKERTGATHALGLLACQVEQTTTSAIIGSGLSVASMFVAPLLVLPPYSKNFTAAFLVDLTTGELTWFNARTGFEIAGLSNWDLRDADSAATVMQATLAPYPVSKTLQRLKQREPDSTTPQLDTDTTPRTGGFSLRPPKDWDATHGRYDLSLTRDGPLFNRVKVSLDEHYRALHETKVSTSTKMSSQELADAVVAELEASHLTALEIVDVSTNMLLAGRPAARIHYRYRQPLAVTDLPMEGILACTTLGRGLLSAQYSAPQLFFFADTLPDFEATLATVQPQPYRSTR